ncbi:ABC transporter substrate-binding protein [Fervidobacterium sp. 2310opik-2]|uniref:ABC transporter substrate-binding protein n=1 Tax=Fervidobacterium sp. 2310opik-2 TaxID=1755815 RepID=UPI0013DF82D9|nr:ABC transporter substrate-binding protein [Fervidobacterium sp. 2310opik-2]KAF2961884.1 branched-chain amino acid ABC transporter substrate-binding protein [Fervidobacterium sp. 2310opik-2]
MKKVFLLTFLILSIAVFPAIRIGVFEPLTGAFAAGGQLTVNGIKLANELFPTVLNQKVELIILDNKTDKVEAANAVTRLIQVYNVSAIIGSYGSSLAIPGSEVANKMKVPMVGCSPTNPLVTKDKPYVFRVCFIDPFQGRVMAKFAVETLKAKTAYIIQDISSDYSVGLAHYFRNAFIEFTKDSKSVLGVASYQGGDQDFTAQLTLAKAKNPDVLFIPAGSYGDAALIMKQAREMGIKATFLGGDTWEVPEIIEVAGDAAEGAYFSTHFDEKVMTTEMTKKFVEAYRKKYNTEPNAFAALGFDAYLLILDAITRAKSSKPEAIKESLETTKGFQGATGVITLDENGDAIKDAIVKKIEKGAFKFVTVVKP